MCSVIAKYGRVAVSLLPNSDCCLEQRTRLPDFSELFLPSITCWIAAQPPVLTVIFNTRHRSQLCWISSDFHGLARSCFPSVSKLFLIFSSPGRARCDWVERRRPLSVLRACSATAGNPGPEQTRSQNSSQRGGNSPTRASSALHNSLACPGPGPGSGRGSLQYYS